MRIAIYDGILETHVGDSLERALTKAGHEVLNTGKIGHGFEFEREKRALRILDIAVAQVIDFCPDVMFCMRPASLPYQLLKKFKDRDIYCVAWFSDDPVLFDLSYGPSLASYDLVLHCGNEKVLQFYEDCFRRPTGVNFPFWTDQEAFPRVWGSETPQYTAMFLGNLQDEVRRSRYFDFGKLGAECAVFGNVGADYFGIGRGYLDSDREVLSAGARSKMAISVPQYFSNHIGLPTWFSGLGDLGFFEYPSRIIQYMSMGIPTINMVKTSASFRTYPEMIVVSSVDQLRDVLLNADTADLQSLSDKTFNRFQHNFSADARVKFLEYLLENDDWKQLDAGERTELFVEYSAELPDENITQEVGDSILGEQRPLILTDPVKPADKKYRIALYGIDDGVFYGRYQTTLRALQNMGHDVILVSQEIVQGSLVKDNRTKYAVAVPRMLDAVEGCDGIFFVNIDVILTSAGAQKIKECGMWTALIDDSQTSSPSRIELLASRFDIYGAMQSDLVQTSRLSGLANVVLTPFFLDESTKFEIADLAIEASDAICVGATELSQETMLPGVATDVRAPFVSYSEIDKCNSLEELASLVRSSVSYISYSGTKQNPKIHPVLPLLIALSEFSFVPRMPPNKVTQIFSSSLLQVSLPREVAQKTRLLYSSESFNRLARDLRTQAISDKFSAEKCLEAMLAVLPKQANSEEINEARKEDIPELQITGLTCKDTLEISRYLPKRPGRAALIKIELSASSTDYVQAASLAIFSDDVRLATFVVKKMPESFILAWGSLANQDKLRFVLESKYPLVPAEYVSLRFFVGEALMAARPERVNRVYESV